MSQLVRLWATLFAGWGWVFWAIISVEEAANDTASFTGQTCSYLYL